MDIKCLTALSSFPSLLPSHTIYSSCKKEKKDNKNRIKRKGSLTKEGAQDLPFKQSTSQPFVQKWLGKDGVSNINMREIILFMYVVYYICIHTCTKRMIMKLTFFIFMSSLFLSLKYMLFSSMVFPRYQSLS